MFASSDNLNPNLARFDYIHINGISNFLKSFVKSKSSRLTVLDVGCGDMPYRELFKNDEYIPCDLKSNSKAVIHCTAENIEYASNSVDVVLSTQMLEHVTDPLCSMKEFYRVIKPNGILLLSTHGIYPYHPGPTDNYRWTGAGLKQLALDAGFKNVKVSGIGGGPSVPLQLILIEYRMVVDKLGSIGYISLELLSVILNTLSIIIDKFFEYWYGEQAYVPLSIVYMIKCQK